MTTIYTIGHSLHTIDRFLDLLRMHGIETLVDVRSLPMSRRAPQFNQRRLAESLAAAGIAYHHNARLGGRPKDESLYDEAGHVLYDRLAQTPAFLEGLEALLALAASSRTAIMCAEENPSKCHRRLLIGRNLITDDTDLQHIRGTGSVEIETRHRPS
jgi:uncharacterized protein (DUF488 family)